MASTGPNRQSGNQISDRWQRYRSHPIAVVLGFALLIAGGLVFLEATAERDTIVSILIALAGAGLGGLGLLIVNGPIAHYVEDQGNQRLARLIGVALAVIGIGAVWLAVRQSSPALAVFGSVLVILGLLFLFAALSDVGEGNPALFTVAGLGLMAMMVLLLWLADGATLLAALALAVGVLGLVVFKIGLGPFIDRSADQMAQERRDVTIAAVATVAVGGALLWLAPRTFDEPLLLGGITLLVVGLTALGIGLVRYEPGRAVAALITAVGVAAVLFGLVQVNGLLSPFNLALLVGLVVAGIGAWFVFRGEALVAVLLLGFVLGWVLVDRVSNDALSPNPDAERTIVAFGDSYISGEGAPRFFPGTNLVGGNQCRRAPTAYPYLAADRLDTDLIFLACSGAVSAALNGNDDGDADGAEVDQLAQLLAEHGDRLDQIDAVLVSIGGNDVGFGTIIKACLLPQSCADPSSGRTERWFNNVDRVGPVLEQTYRGLRDTLGPDVPIVVIQYPVIIEPSPTCDLTIGDDEIEFVGRFTDALNQQIAGAAAAAGVNVVSTADAFAGRRLCDEDPATNFIQLSPSNGPIGQRVLPSAWVHGSMHPRDDGHALIADVLVDRSGQGELAQLLDDIDAGVPANPSPAGSGAGPGPEPQYEELPDSAWIQQRLFETVRDLIAPVATLLLGGQIAAWGVLGLNVPVLSFLNPRRELRSRSGESGYRG